MDKTNELPVNTHYAPFGGSGWDYGEKMLGHNEWHQYLGPCPHCGNRCFDYGGGWRCLNYGCTNSANNPIGNLGPLPAWWNTGIQVIRDGDAWCAHEDNFINLQESIAGFGNTPNEAVSNLVCFLNAQTK